jgi:hypothetical protein
MWQGMRALPIGGRRHFMAETAVSKRTLRIVDAGVIVWIVVWAILGVVSFVEVRGLESLSDTMQMAGQSLQEAGDGLNTIADLPLVGGSIDAAAEKVQSLATRTINEADASRTHISRLSVLAVLVGGVIPILMALCIYVPLRRSWTRKQPAAADLGGGDL